MTGPHIYSAVDDLVIRLRAERADTWADRLSDAISGGATGTEILMALRWTLRELEASDVSLQQATRLQAETLRHDVETVLDE